MRPLNGIVANLTEIHLPSTISKSLYICITVETCADATR